MMSFENFLPWNLRDLVEDLPESEREKTYNEIVKLYRELYESSFKQHEILDDPIGVHKPLYI